MRKSRDVRGGHTTYIDLAQQVVSLVAKKFKEASFSPGIIIAGINAKTKKLALWPQNDFVVTKVVMGHTKQEIRIFKVSPQELLKFLKNHYQGSVAVEMRQQ